MVEKKNKPFRFANFIADREEFLATVEKEWNCNVQGVRMCKLVKKLKNLKSHMRNLSWKNGNVHERVKITRDKLVSAQLLVYANPHDAVLKEKESIALKEYNEAVDEEEKFLYQKAKGKVRNGHTVTQSRLGLPTGPIVSGIEPPPFATSNAFLSMSNKKRLNKRQIKLPQQYSDYVENVMNKEDEVTDSGRKVINDEGGPGKGEAKDMSVYNGNGDLIGEENNGNEGITLENNDGEETVVFDEEIVQKGSMKWSNTVCGYFVGQNMSIHELRYHIRRMWSRFGVKDINENGNGMNLFKFKDEIGMNQVLSQRPWMVNSRPMFVQKWDPEIGMTKVEPVKLPVWGSKEVQVEYELKPERCSHCMVFGHSFGKCKARPKTVDEIKEQVAEEEMIKAKENNEGFTEVQYTKRSMVQQRKNGQYRNYGPQVQRQEYRKKDSGKDKGKAKMNEETTSRTDTDKFRSGGSNTNREVNRSQKNSDDIGKGGSSSVNRFEALNTTKEGDTEEVMEGVNEMAQTMTQDNVVETHVKPHKLPKVCEATFGSWNWISNVNHSQNGCRILVSWYQTMVDVVMIHSSKQAMLCMIEIIANKTKFFCSFVYAANSGKERKELWRDLNRDQRIASGFPWLISGDFNVTLKTMEHSAGGSVLTEILATVEKEWNCNVQGVRMCKLVKKLKNLKSHMRNLSWKNGNVHERVKITRDKLVSAQLLVYANPHDAVLKEKESIALKEYNEAVDEEEKFLYQKAKGEVTNDEGEVLEGDLMEMQFVNHFKKFLGNSNNNNTEWNLEGIFGNTLSRDEAEQMVREVTDMEIKNAMLSKFFKKAWHIVGPDVCLAVKEFFQTGKLLGEMNATLVPLVPKVPHPSKVNEFRPIACCNVVYKCISKILTNRIKESLKKLVDLNQSAFIEGRLIQDNILITQELLKGYDRKNGPKRCCLKIDLAKAYDTVEWSFLKEILGKFGFHNKMIQWIMVCVTTAKFSICLNGDRKGYFRSGRGLRQGDPISPYLFTLFMKVFTLLMKRNAQQRGFKYHMGCKEVQLTHLCFADDLLVLCHADINSITIIKNTLLEFNNAYGLLPNMNKSTAFFCNVGQEEMNKILEILPFRIGKLPVKYLGVPLITKRIGAKECKQLIDKVKSRVHDWKNKYLSYVGRLQLIASVLASMHVYWAAVFLLPKSVIYDIDRVLKGFLWSKGELKKGQAKVAWKTVCTPKSQGGLGLRKLDTWNEAC
ncbi:reverse transcriptase domain, Reverse transcriptase zinc-binding domain protein [Artemisia annua]|uniref:Reverse transcriptase domain, Reverse transcriptase zinc-binding domain protein n=1 Tax=Artemisia annua TaxID=35608 RepID=A0A2U1PQV2_ARTAN|nr:reverse transcriptase domain, Reverse transcriptase zinc-binding domain protein [Artemisia annua]